MKMENAHGAAELEPGMFAAEQSRCANQNENEADARAQKEQAGLAIFSEKFQHARMLADCEPQINS